MRGGLVADVLALPGRQVLEDPVDGLAGLVVELVEWAVTGAVVGDDGLGYPGAVDVAEEVVGWTDGRITVLEGGGHGAQPIRLHDGGTAIVSM